MRPLLMLLGAAFMLAAPLIYMVGEASHGSHLDCSFYDETSCAKDAIRFMPNEADDLYYFENVPCWKRSKCYFPGEGSFHFDRLPPEEPIPHYGHTKPCVGVMEGHWFVRDPRNLTKTYEYTKNGKKVFVSKTVKSELKQDNMVWEIDHPHCKQHWFDSRQIYRCLKGRRVIFAGDSLLRQMMVALLSTLRGNRRPMLTNTHADIAYLMHGDRDELFVEERQRMDLFWNSSQSRRSYHKPDTMELMFTMDPFNTQLMESTDLELLRPDVLISGSFFWETTLQERQRAMAPSLSSASYAPKKWIHLLQPESVGHPESSLFIKRNRLNEAFFKKLMKKHPGKVYLAGFDRMAAAAPIPATDQVHFQCSANKDLYNGGTKRDMGNMSEVIKSLARESNGSLPRSDACWDGMNMALIQVLLNFICLDDPMPPGYY